MDISWAINIWQVTSCVDGNENISFYKTVLIDSKPFAIQINKEEFECLAEHLRPGKIMNMPGVDYFNPESFQLGF